MLKAPPSSSQYNPQQQMVNPQEVYRAHPPISNITRPAFTTSQLSSHQQKGQNCLNTSLQMSSSQHEMCYCILQAEAVTGSGLFPYTWGLLMSCHLVFVAPAPPKRGNHPRFPQLSLLPPLSVSPPIRSVISSSNCQFPKAARSATKNHSWVVLLQSS